MIRAAPNVFRFWLRGLVLLVLLGGEVRGVGATSAASSASPASAASRASTAGAASSSSSSSSAAADSTARVTLTTEIRAALQRGNWRELAILCEEARDQPSDPQAPLVEIAAAMAELRAQRWSLAASRLAGAGGLAVVAAALAVFLGAIAAATLIYVPVAAVFAAFGRARIGLDLPADLTAPECERRMQVPPGTEAVWRSPLGLGAGLLATLADDGIGWLASLAIARFAFGSVAPVLTFDMESFAGAVSALAGTGIGNLGAMALVMGLYRSRGAGWRSAGLVPLPPLRVLRLASRVAFALLAFSIVHDLTFRALAGREARSHVEPLLEALLGTGSAPVALVGLFLVVVLIAPFVEELVYRGVLYRAFRDRAGVPLAIAGSAFLFAITHFEPDHFLALAAIGAVLAWVFERTGSLWPAIAVHAVYNGLSLGLYLIGRLHSAS